jgi:tetratricopeptide (TPR) repeat protein
MPGDELRPEVRLAARVAAMEDLLLLGRRDEVGPLVDQAVDEAAAFDHPYWRWSVTTWRALIAIVDGDLERAEELAFAALSHQPTNVEAIAALGVELVDIRLLQGRAEEVLGLLVQAVADNPTIPAYRAVLALCAASAGDLDLARATFDRFAERDFMDLPADSNRFLALAVLADTGLRLGDTERTPRLRELLTPYSGLQVVLNCYGGGGAWWGPVDELLERLGGRQATTSARRGS